MSRALQIGAVALTAASILAACAGGNDQPGGSPSSSPAAATSGGAQGGEAPKVPAPLPVDALLSNPCTGALSASQLSSLAMAAPGKSSNDQNGPTCTWDGTVNTVNSISIAPLPVNKNGLSDIYANNDDKKYAYFEPTSIDGYPAAYADPSDGRANGFCSLWVGVTDQLAVLVSTQLGVGPNKTHPCDSANKVGTAMIEHLKSAA